MSDIKGSHHHIRPKSRGGRNKGNLVQLPREFHVAYHILAENMTLPEFHRFLDIIMQPDKHWTSQEIHDLRQSILKEGGWDG
jgi:hypothetical protein